jgi:hypothetical protein
VPTDVVDEGSEIPKSERPPLHPLEVLEDKLRRKTMVGPTMDLSAWLRKQLEVAEPDLLRDIVQEMAEALMRADVDATCNAP